MSLARAPGTAGGTFAALGNRNFRLYWFGQLISQSGSWMQGLAQSWLVLSLTGSALALGTVTMLQFLPILLFSAVGGVLADRVPKRTCLLVTQTALACQALALALLSASGAIRLWEIYALATALGLFNAVDNPMRRAFLVELVGREDLANASALNETLLQSARIVGPALGGVAVAALGFTGCFLLNSVSFAALLAGLARMRPAEFFQVPPQQHGSVLTSLREGLRYALGAPEIALILLLTAVMGVFGFNYSTFLPLLARYVLRAGPTGLGSITACLGTGALLAALWVARSHSVSLRQQFASATAFALLLLALSTVRSLPPAMALLLCLGAASVTFQVTASTRVQLAVPDHLRGRVVGLYTMLLVGGTPLGALFVGETAQHWGVSTSMALAGAVCATGIVLALWLARRRAVGPWLAPGPAATGPDGR